MKKGKKRAVKIILRIFLSILALLILLPALLYVPPIQNFARNQLEKYAAENLDMQLTIGRIRLGFPLRLSIDEAMAVVPTGDTLFNAGRLRTNAALWPLLRSELLLRDFELANASVHLHDTVTRLELRARLGELGIPVVRAHLKNQQASIREIKIADGNVFFIPASVTVDTIAKADTVPLRWVVDVNKLSVSNIDFAMQTTVVDTSRTEIAARVPNGEISGVNVALEDMEVVVGNLTINEAEAAYITVPYSDNMPTRLFAGFRSDSLPVSGPKRGLDLTNLYVMDLNIDIDSVYYQDMDIRAVIHELALREQSGITVEHTQGSIAMDSTAISLRNFQLKTPRSSIDADANVGMAIATQDPDTPVDLNLRARLDLTEIMSYLPAGILPAPTPAPMRQPGEAASIQQLLAGKMLNVDSDIDGKLGDVQIRQLAAVMPGNFNIGIIGEARSVTNPDAMSGTVKLDAALTSLDFLRAMLPDTALRRRIQIPDNMRLNGTLALSPDRYRPNLQLRVGEGVLALTGDVGLRAEQYRADLNITDFPLYRFLPTDSLGLVALTLHADGHGFDPAASTTAMNAALAIDRFDYKGYNFEAIALNAALQDHHLAGELTSDNPSLQARLDLDGLLTPERYEAGLKGRISRADLLGMRLATDSLAFATSLDIMASMVPAQNNLNASNSGSLPDSIAAISLNATLDNIWVRMPTWSNNIYRTTIETSSSSNGTHLGLQSGDLTLVFDSPVAMDSLLAGVSHLGEVLPEQLRQSDFDMAGLGESLPPLQLDIKAARNNVLHNFLRPSGIDFSRLGVSARVSADDPFRLDLNVNRLVTGGLRLDTITANIAQRDHQLDYTFRVANAPGNLDSVGLILIEGNIVHDEFPVHLMQQDRNRRTGFDFNLNGMLADSMVRVSVTPDNPVLGFDTWSVNPGNFVAYHFNNEIYADLRLTNGDQHFILSSASWPGESIGALRVDIAGIDIGNTLRVFPAAPVADGTFNTNLLFAMANKAIDVEGTISVGDMSYDRKQVGDIGLDVVYHMDSLSNHQGNVKLLLNQQEALIADGHYYTTLARGGVAPTDSVSLAPAVQSGYPVSISVQIPSLPLDVANAFIPDDMANLTGALQGDLDVKGTPAKLRINGGLQFTDTRVDVIPVGTAFQLSNERIPITENLLRFDNYKILSPNNSTLNIDGTLNMQDFAAIMTDLAVTASDFRVVDVSRNRNSMVYGTASIDLNSTIKGRLDRLSVRGDLSLLSSTDVVYTMWDNSLDLQSEQQDIVTFVSFLDSTAVYQSSHRAVRTEGMDLLMNVNINDGVSAAVYLSNDGSNRIDVVGNGNLTLSMNRQGDTRLTGRYVLTGGNVYYNPPVISQKEFAINDGSHIEWTGELADPSFDIKATESLRASVDSEGSNPRQVTFNIMIIIQNTLNNLAISFDLAAPQDLEIQNELGGFTAEQRSSQAMNLLLFNTYSGLGTTARGNTVNPLNSFIEKELNSWARNNLKGVDLSFGIDQYDEFGTSGESTRTDYSYQLSKNLFNNRVRAVIGGRVSTDSEAGATGSFTDNLVDDISLEYFLNDRQNMYLKLFRYNSYESILEGEVISTGIGFVMHKNLYRLGDLFRFRQNPETRLVNFQQRALERRQEEDNKNAEEEKPADDAVLPEKEESEESKTATEAIPNEQTSTLTKEENDPAEEKVVQDTLSKPSLVTFTQQIKK